MRGKAVGSSKQSRSTRRSFRMEIFVGFSIRPRSTPCPSSKDLTERAGKGSFQKSKPNSSLSILFQTNKTGQVFNSKAFEQHQFQNTAFAAKRAEKTGQTEKQPNRKHVQDVSEKSHFCCLRGLCYQFLHIADSEITALILHHDVFQ